MSVKTHLPWRMEFAAIQTKPTCVGFKFFESAHHPDFVCVAAISNRLVYLLSLRCSRMVGSSGINYELRITNYELRITPCGTSLCFNLPNYRQRRVTHPSSTFAGMGRITN
jgi:hypothetical protein